MRRPHLQSRFYLKIARRATAVALATPMISILTGACAYHAPSDFCSQFENAPLKEAVGEPAGLVFSDPLQRFAVFHGSACARSEEDGRENIIKVRQSLRIPPPANRVAVFLNGWDVRYLHKDHKVEGFGTVIGKIGLSGDTLTWQAAGILSDKNFDDAYEWCYHFTVLVWDDAALQLTVDQDDAGRFCNADSAASDNFYYASNARTTTALSVFSSFLQNAAFLAPGSVAILPRGFGFKADGDHNVFQVAYNLDHGEEFVEQGKRYRKALQGVEIPSTESASHADSGYVSWDTYAIFKDNKKRRAYAFGEMVSVLGGPDVAVVQPPYSILPKEDAGWTEGCVASSQPDVMTEVLSVENLPFACAIPMLTGWELKYACDDEHVTEMGVWIDGWSFTPAPTGGTLQYTLSSSLRDRDNDPEHVRSHKVTILGLLPQGGALGGPGIRAGVPGPGQNRGPEARGSTR